MMKDLKVEVTEVRCFFLSTPFLCFKIEISDCRTKMLSKLRKSAFWSSRFDFPSCVFFPCVVLDVLGVVLSGVWTVSGICNYSAGEH